MFPLAPGNALLRPPVRPSAYSAERTMRGINAPGARQAFVDFRDRCGRRTKAVCGGQVAAGRNVKQIPESQYRDAVLRHEPCPRTLNPRRVEA